MFLSVVKRVSAIQYSKICNTVQRKITEGSTEQIRTIQRKIKFKMSKNVVTNVRCEDTLFFHQKNLYLLFFFAIYITSFHVTCYYSFSVPHSKCFLQKQRISVACVCHTPEPSHHRSLLCIPLHTTTLIHPTHTYHHPHPRPHPSLPPLYNQSTNKLLLPPFPLAF